MFAAAKSREMIIAFTAYSLSNARGVPRNSNHKRDSASHWITGRSELSALEQEEILWFLVEKSEWALQKKVYDFVCTLQVFSNSLYCESIVLGARECQTILKFRTST